MCRLFDIIQHTCQNYTLSRKESHVLIDVLAHGLHVNHALQIDIYLLTYLLNRFHRCYSSINFDNLDRGTVCTG